jgi:NADP-dependent 3-hydroxy acid dehydrogenase YdfG
MQASSGLPVSPTRRVKAFTLEDLDPMVDVNVRGVFLAIQASVAGCVRPRAVAGADR